MNKLKELEKKIEKLRKDLKELKCELDKAKSNNCERYRANCGESMCHARVIITMKKI